VEQLNLEHEVLGGVDDRQGRLLLVVGMAFLGMKQFLRISPCHPVSMFQKRNYF
jgi:hypothetical protein